LDEYITLLFNIISISVKHLRRDA